MERLGPSGRRLTRRDVLRDGLALGGVVAGGGLLAACGGGAKSGTPATGTTTETIKHGGTLRIGFTSGGPDGRMSPLRAPDQITSFRVAQVWEGFGIRNTGELFPSLDLAEEVTPNRDASEWTVRLKSGVEFHNGKTMTSRDALYSLQYMLDPKSESSAGGSLLQSIDIKRTKILDDRTLRIKLRYPLSIFNEILLGGAISTIAIMHEGWKPGNYIGTGPFTVKSFEPGQQTVLERFPNYHGDPLPYLDGVVIHEFAETTARVNALLSGQVDAVDTVPGAQVATIKQRSNLRPLIAHTGAVRVFEMNCRTPPFDDVRVRQALKYSVDRKEMVERALSGFGEPAYDVFGKNADPAYRGTNFNRPHDPERARSLLKAAGYANQQIDVVNAPVASGATESSQVLVQQANAAGFNLRNRQVGVDTIYGDQYLRWPLHADWYPTHSFYNHVLNTNLPKAQFNSTHWENPRFLSLFKQVGAETDDAKRHDLIHEMMQLDFDEGGTLLWAFVDQVDAISTKVVGMRGTNWGRPLGAHLKGVGLAS